MGIRELALQQAKRQYQDFRLSNGMVARVRSLTERERADYEAGLLDPKGGFNKDRLLSARRRLVCMTLVEPTTNELAFSINEEHLLADLNGKFVEDLYQAAKSICGISDSDVEAIVKNSDATPVAD
jgi:hypothetical protein